MSGGVVVRVKTFPWHCFLLSLSPHPPVCCSVRPWLFISPRKAMKGALLLRKTEQHSAKASRLQCIPVETSLLPPRYSPKKPRWLLLLLRYSKKAQSCFQPSSPLDPFSLSECHHGDAITPIEASSSSPVISSTRGPDTRSLAPGDGLRDRGAKDRGLNSGRFLSSCLCLGGRMMFCAVTGETDLLEVSGREH